ncbi:DUF6320 domain-containing protein [Anaerolentibacter hominis]|uniref:DUF6320 domain-containing protein n=1 Tax=Anaerolentibacter hominis TaxID=3079009 RepID=UPI0031B82B67
MMKRCNHCHVLILDNTNVCPLCRNALEGMEGKEGYRSYPVIQENPHQYPFVIRIFLFLSIVQACVLVGVNYLTYSAVWWSLIPVGATLYFWITLYYSIQNNTNSAAKILVQTLCAQLLALLIDFSLGYTGWSVNYAIPSIFIVANLAMLVLMIVNFMNWQSYILFQIEYVVFSLIPIVLHLVGIITKPLLSFIGAGMSVLILLGTIVFGDRKAKEELKRRFHV